jgi:two-component system CheB/CheR fusion protein
LGKELRDTKEYLQSTIEELEASNEELKSSNEEMMSLNEELQSANEELETSKEEMQSLNEELVTVNTELQGRVDELTALSDDIRNLLESIEIGTIFLDRELRIKRFTAEATKVISLIPTDLGRPINDLDTKLKYRNLVSDAEEVLKGLIPKQQEVQTEGGHWYVMRIKPYHTADMIIDGVVITFSDIHRQKITEERLERTNQELQAARDLAEGIVETVREPLLVLDHTFRVISANRAFYKTFRVRPEETTGQFIYELGSGQWDIPRLRELLEEIIPTDSVFENFDVEHDFPAIGYKKMLLNGRRIVQQETGTQMILLAIEEANEQGR